MPFLHTEDFDDPLPSPFDGDLYARFHADSGKLSVEEFLASKYRANSRVQPERSWDVILHDALSSEPPTPEAYPYAEKPLEELAADFFTGRDPEAEISAQHDQHYGLAAWARALLNGFRRAG